MIAVHALDAIRKPDDEVVAVRHDYLWQRLRVYRVALADKLVQREDVGRDRVDLVVGEGVWFRIGHRAAHEVEDRRRVEPVILDRLAAVEAGAGGTTHQGRAVFVSFAVIAMTR